jgi:hypothetical protein
MEYTFHCENPRCQKVSPVQGKPLKFLEESRAKGMQMAMLACPACGLTQPFNPQDPMGKTQKAQPKKSPPKKAAPSLPAKYLTWLEGLGRKRTVSFDDSDWNLATSQQLAKTVNVDGNRAPYLEQARLFVQTLAEFMPHAVDVKNKPFPLSRIEGFLTIGSDNEDLLCIDPSDKFSVWRFAPSEGGYVEQLADSLADFMREATS